MTSGVSWDVEDLPEQTREAAQEAARRSGMSVREWLDTVISDRAKSDESRAGTASHQNPTSPTMPAGTDEHHDDQHRQPRPPMRWPSSGDASTRSAASSRSFRT